MQIYQFGLELQQLTDSKNSHCNDNTKGQQCCNGAEDIIGS